MQGGWQPPPGGGGGGYGPPPGGGWTPPGGTQQGFSQQPPQQQGYAPNPYAAPNAPMGPPGMPPPAYGNYEFNEYENSVIGKTASRAKLWGIISIVVGVLQFLSSCGMFAKADLAANLPVGIVGVIVGVTFLGAANALNQVVTTQGNDMMYMMQALEKLSSAFIIQIICLVVGVILAAVILAVALFVLVAVAASNS